MTVRFTYLWNISLRCDVICKKTILNLFRVFGRNLLMWPVFFTTKWLLVSRTGYRGLSNCFAERLAHIPEWLSRIDEPKVPLYCRVVVCYAGCWFQEHCTSVPVL